MPEYTNISIPRPLYDRCAEAIQGTGFRSVTEFIVFVLREAVAEAGTTMPTYEDERGVEDRMRGLRYLR